ncbi:MAG: hypothetical protein LBE95_01085 [Holosporaceae bacterium]|jgi:hypothetical protein|nr:hypothetical protein [Holosporaceae bacterium]
MNDDLDILIKKLGIVDAETGVTPSSEEELGVVKIQLLAAEVIADDVKKIRNAFPHLTDEEIIDQLLHNWTENIRDFVISLIAIREKMLDSSKFSGISRN